MKSHTSLLKVLAILAVILTSCTGQEKSNHAAGNRLSGETSPYLLQHANNPVDWYPWGDEALARAKKESKLMVISIGYSACHWCHVMERESYQDSAVAKLMNESYISIKIDREERPDIDQVYIEAAQIMNNGQAGWPLNAITLPDGTPIFTGTYFPRDQWLNLLETIQNIYENDPDRLKVQAEKIREDLMILNQGGRARPNNMDEDKLTKSILHWVSNMDSEYGGLRGDQKFPLASGLSALLDYSFVNQFDTGLNMVELTLDKIALGGIYDHLAGGFHRYTVEPSWQIPHFEKMLYDNAQLISAYSKAYKVFGKVLYKDRVIETMNFLSTKMKSSEGGFYSSFDADTEDEEGKFYVWSSSEVDSILGSSSDDFKKRYSITPSGNWEDGKNVIFLSKEQEDSEEMKAAREQLLNERNKRILPRLDDKILTSWNALMISAALDAYHVIGDEEYLNMAIEAGNFISEKQMMADGQLFRNYKDGNSAINAFLDDYALTASAFLSLYQSTFDLKWVTLSKKLVDYTLDHFYNDQRGLFKYTSDLDESLIVDKFVVSDDVIPSGNSSMAKNLSVLGELYYESDLKYSEIANQMLADVSQLFEEDPYYYYGWLPLYSNSFNSPFEIAIVGPGFKDILKEIQNKYYIPNAVFLGGADDKSLPLLENKLVEGETYIYVCRNKYCRLPVQDVKSAMNQIDQEQNKSK